jgi:hypothetical protein
VLLTGAPAGLELWQGEEQLANGTVSGDYCFRGLSRGQYSLKAGGKFVKGSSPFSVR